MSFEQRIIATKNKLNYNEKQVVEYMYKNKALLTGLKIQDLAINVHLSKSFISKLIKKLGYSSFAEFKVKIKAESTQYNKLPNSDLIEAQKKDLQETERLLQQVNFSAIFKVLDYADFIYCYGTGHSNQNCIKELSRNLMSIGNKRVVYLSGKSELESIIPLITDRNCLIVSSHSGESQELIDILEMFKLKQSRIISITAFSNNTLVRLADYNLFYFSTLIKNPIHNNKIYSFLPLNLCIDTLIRKYLEHLN
ncbi:MurR/RpiR family transcriptional regulator [Xylocopilactobacillus apicola]|uniref:RpiR family transcriptional regulator n=1 Tax=Xylocopilactobacillus apicola TaxID=2932184 RepID=A0AAU9DHH6_9LACO|nr:MurR/RpiR family transcriptional regulator [Xylocopilactobacillus apicola]BDR57751.1 RpiR family transcriptional regulator [Xylocopilactobacillus apicola]